MPEIELSRLNRDEMRRLLAAAEARRDHELAGRLRAELGGRSAALHLQQMRPDRGWEADEDDVEDAEASGARRRVMSTILAVVAAAVVAMVIGWQLGRREAPAPPPPAAIAPAQVVEAPEHLVPELMPAQPLPSAQSPAEAAPAPRVAAVKPVARPEKVRTERRVERAAAPQRLPRDRRMLQAYERARAAGVDPLVLDAEQARFRTEVGGTRDPVRTNALYERRIRELQAAARPAR